MTGLAADGRADRHALRAERVAARAKRTFLPELQALRAIAISLVLLFHFFPQLQVLTGAFTGVDVFFVLSGYLITAHLLKEAEATGTVSLPAFYARRARRLLPASLTILLITLAASVALLPRELWGLVARGALAATFYVENLWAATMVALSPGEDVYALPVVHYWSLSTEEQFYLAWPALILAGLWITRHRAGSRRHPFVATTIVLSVAALASFVASIVHTIVDQPIAFFATTTRAWEFAAGGLTMLLLRVWAPGARTAVVLRLAGLALILVASATLTSEHSFPGVAALIPVVGTAAVIVAGEPAAGSLMRRLVDWTPTQWVGRISYSVYLWHWPVVVLAPYALGTPVLQWPQKIALGLLILALGHVSQRYLEDATRYFPRIRNSTRATLLTALATMLLVAACALAVRVLA